MRNLQSLPTLGLGVSLSLGEKPDPVHMFSQAGGPQFIEYAGLCDVNRIIPDLQPLLENGVPLLFHPSFINFCGTFANHRDWLETANEHLKTVNSPWLAQDCAYCFWGDVPGYSSQYGYFVPPILNEHSLHQALQRIIEVKKIITCPIAIEPPPVSFVVGSMTPMQFFGRLACLADCGLLLDVGHLFSYQLATGISVKNMLDDFPLDRVIELHIAGGAIREVEGTRVYLDAHEKPIIEPVFEWLDVCLSRLTNLKAVCYECEGVAQSDALQILSRIRDRVLNYSSSPDLIQKVKYNMVDKPFLMNGYMK